LWIREAVIPLPGKSQSNNEEWGIFMELNNFFNGKRGQRAG
jgi:hypothetical protein